MRQIFKINAGDCAASGTDAAQRRWRKPMRKYINVAVLLFVLGMCAAPMWAQLEGVIRGTVKGQDGKPLGTCYGGPNGPLALG